MSHLFAPLTLRGVTFPNRVMMSPMCQYCAGTDGVATDWHFVHYGSRAVGGSGLVMLEATAVEARGRISENDLGLWDEAQVEPLARIARYVKSEGARVGIQLAHAGRKAWTATKAVGPTQPVAPSAIPFAEGWVVPEALNLAGIDQVVASFRQAAQWSVESGFEVIELHFAHGYLAHEFMSPISNQRTDEYGGSFANRLRLPHRIIDAIRSVWPEDKPLFVRVSCVDYIPGGLDLEQTVEIARSFKKRGVDLIDCSSGLIRRERPENYPGYQVPLAEHVRREADMPAAAVGVITAPEQAEEIVRNGRADLVAVGRAMLADAYWAMHAAAALKAEGPWPVQYERAK